MAVVQVTLEVRSRKGIRALRAAVRRLNAIRADQPWNDDAKVALRALRTVTNELLVRTT